MAGPYATTLMAHLGADVLKVEKPVRGDLMRFTDRNIQGRSGYFLGVNQGKRGLTADMRKPEGQEIIRRLVERSDVLVENYRGGKMAEWNLSYEDLRKINPGLVYCSLTMYADDIPGYANLVGNDKIAQATSGLMDNTGEREGLPTRLGAPVVDATGGFLSAIGILAALYKRTFTGVGDHVKVSLLEAAYALMPPWVPSILNSDAQFTRQGHKHPLLAPYQVFQASDGKYMVIGAFHEESWRRLCDVIGLTELIDDPRFGSNTDRLKNREALDPLVEKALLAKPAVEWQDLLEAAGVPVAPIRSIRESLDHFSHLAPQLLAPVEDDVLGTVSMLRPPIRLTESATPPRPSPGAPGLGADNDAVLADLGFTAEDIDEFRHAKVI
jgi:crotonobetainyl-CoA:carnitine CoA-transferase CaiB-like acyl-CoA transferase